MALERLRCGLCGTIFTQKLGEGYFDYFCTPACKQKFRLARIDRTLMCPPKRCGQCGELLKATCNAFFCNEKCETAFVEALRVEVSHG